MGFISSLNNLSNYVLLLQSSFKVLNATLNLIIAEQYMEARGKPV